MTPNRTSPPQPPVHDTLQAAHIHMLAQAVLLRVALRHRADRAQAARHGATPATPPRRAARQNSA